MLGYCIAHLSIWGFNSHSDFIEMEDLNDTPNMKKELVKVASALFFFTSIIKSFGLKMVR